MEHLWASIEFKGTAGTGCIVAKRPLKAGEQFKDLSATVKEGPAGVDDIPGKIKTAINLKGGKGHVDLSVSLANHANAVQAGSGREPNIVLKVHENDSGEDGDRKKYLVWQIVQAIAVGKELCADPNIDMRRSSRVKVPVGGMWKVGTG